MKFIIFSNQLFGLKFICSSFFFMCQWCTCTVYDRTPLRFLSVFSQLNKPTEWELNKLYISFLRQLCLLMLLLLLESVLLAPHHRYYYCYCHHYSFFTCYKQPYSTQRSLRFQLNRKCTNPIYSIVLHSNQSLFSHQCKKNRTKTIICYYVCVCVRHLAFYSWFSHNPCNNKIEDQKTTNKKKLPLTRSRR